MKQFSSFWVAQENLRWKISENSNFNLRGGGSYLVECIHGKSSCQCLSPSSVSLTSFKVSLFLTSSPPMSCLCSSRSTEKLIAGRPDVRAEESSGLSVALRCSGLAMSDSTLNEMPLDAVERLWSIICTCSRVLRS